MTNSPAPKPPPRARWPKAPPTPTIWAPTSTNYAPKSTSFRPPAPPAPPPCTPRRTAALAGLDDTHRRAVSAITTNIHSVQLLHLHPGADKTATLAALADTAHHHNKHILALTGTDGAADPRTYADTTATIDTLPRRPHRQAPHATAGQPAHRR